MVTLVAVYAALPKGIRATGTMLSPVPLIILGYLAFTLTRLALAYTRQLPEWMIFISNLADMGLLMGLIWSYHIQYDQPASFYLKSPTLLWVFLFIALRALRFDPRFVLMAGFVGALGWQCLVFYALYDDSLQTPVVAQNYVEYATSTAISLWVELDKTIMILMVTIVLSVALARARRVMVNSLAEGQAASDLARFFTPEIARRITDSDHQIHAGQGEMREAAIVMIDLRGFTKLAETAKPDAVIALLTEYQARVVPVIQRHGGSIDKFMGDGIIATFGLTSQSRTYAADALQAVEGVLGVAKHWTGERAARGEDPVRLNAAVATGPVLFGAVGDASRLEYTVIGEPVNLCAKLEKHNKAIGSDGLATADAWKLALSQGYTPANETELHQECEIPGVARPIDLVTLHPAPDAPEGMAMVLNLPDRGWSEAAGFAA
jgi:adenylate cyclase